MDVYSVSIAEPDTYAVEITAPSGKVTSVVLNNPVAIEAQVFAGYVGPRGPKGDSGASETVPFVSPLAVWTIAHNLGRKPSVEVYSPGGLMIFASILHLNNDIVEISFDDPQSGFAIIT
jgi:hypothetical protein